jgi:hypothetical protein
MDVSGAWNELQTNCWEPNKGKTAVQPNTARLTTVRSAALLKLCWMPARHTTPCAPAVSRGGEILTIWSRGHSPCPQ